MSSMFCYQCEQTAKGTGCDAFGVCGKDPDTAALQDLLVHAAKGIAQYGHRARALGARDPDVDVFLIEALFTTVTNVNFDPGRIGDMLRQAAAMRDRARALYTRACAEAGRTPETPEGPAAWVPADDLDGLIRQGEKVGIEAMLDLRGADLVGLEQLLTYGLKGMAAYADHAHRLDRHDDAVFAFFHEALDRLARADGTVEDLLALNLRCGEVNLKVMAMLDSAHTGSYGTPVPTPVRITPVEGKAILVSGHDLHDLKAILEQTEGKGIYVYTHGEMLPAHGYPGLKKFKHLYGNYGTAWQRQQKEFPEFPGPIVMTTNCLQKPKDSYLATIYTREMVGWPGAKHIEGTDYSEVVEKALAMPGFPEDEDQGSVKVGFAHNAVLGVADKVIEAVKSGALKHIYLVAGCDGAKPGRNYYSEFVEQAPADTIVLTLACGKYRFYDQDLGDIGGIPRLLDMGQCNDAYSAIKVASALSEAFDTEINDLPLSLIISWYEQKAVAILLTLLYLGLRDIRLGPSLPAFITPNVLNVLVEKFNIMPIKTAEEDLAATLG